MSGRVPTVFVVDDEPSVRKAIERLLRSAGLIVSTKGSAQDYLESYDPDASGCLVLDLSMPGFSGLELQDALIARGSVLPIIFLTGRADVPDSVRALKRGAVEFLIKPVDDEALLDAVRRAIALDQIQRSRQAELEEIRGRLDELTPRELQVLRCVIAGKLNKQIAAELGTVEKTIKVHRAHVMEKMQVTSVAALVQLALKAGVSS